jgi:hypothetical protein
LHSLIVHIHGFGGKLQDHADHEDSGKNHKKDDDGFFHGA